MLGGEAGEGLGWDFDEGMKMGGDFVEEFDAGGGFEGLAAKKGAEGDGGFGGGDALAQTGGKVRMGAK